MHSRCNLRRQARGRQDPRSNEFKTRTMAFASSAISRRCSVRRRDPWEVVLGTFGTVMSGAGRSGWKSSKRRLATTSAAEGNTEELAATATGTQSRLCSRREARCFTWLGALAALLHSRGEAPLNAASPPES